MVGHDLCYVAGVMRMTGQWMQRVIEQQLEVSNMVQAAARKGFRVLSAPIKPVHYDMVQEACDSLQYGSVSEYTKRVMLAHAAETLGVEPVDMAAEYNAGLTDMRRAAVAAGESVEQFKARVIAEATARILAETARHGIKAAPPAPVVSSNGKHRWERSAPAGVMRRKARGNKAR